MYTPTMIRWEHFKVTKRKLAKYEHLKPLLGQFDFRRSRWRTVLELRLTGSGNGSYFRRSFGSGSTWCPGPYVRSQRTNTRIAAPLYHQKVDEAFTATCKTVGLLQIFALTPMFSSNSWTWWASMVQAGPFKLGPCDRTWLGAHVHASGRLRTHYICNWVQTLAGGKFTIYPKWAFGVKSSPIREKFRQVYGFACTCNILLTSRQTYTCPIFCPLCPHNHIYCSCS